jgi:putative PIN family toxin of toxin-antitoxin system
VLRGVFTGRFRLLLSPDLLAELRRVLEYPKLRFSAEDTATFLATLLEAAELVLPNERIVAVEADPADNRVLECAVSGRADFIISGDSHLKHLQTFRNIPILAPSELLARFPGRS